MSSPEESGTVPCPQCGGLGHTVRRTALRGGIKSAVSAKVVCSLCNGTMRVQAPEPAPEEAKPEEDTGECQHCGQPVQGKMHYCANRVTAEVIRRIVREELKAAIPAIALALAAVTPAKAASWQPEVVAGETVYQALSVVDTVQSLSIARHPEQYSESTPFTAHCIGRHPNEARTIAFGAGRGLLHAGVTHELVAHQAPRWLVGAWEGLSISYEGYYVGKNRSIGIRWSSAR